jgi:hypothetical protein
MTMNGVPKGFPTAANMRQAIQRAEEAAKRTREEREKAAREAQERNELGWRTIGINFANEILPTLGQFIQNNPVSNWTLQNYLCRNRHNRIENLTVKRYLANGHGDDYTYVASSERGDVLAREAFLSRLWEVLEWAGYVVKLTRDRSELRWELPVTGDAREPPFYDTGSDGE